MSIFSKLFKSKKDDDSQSSNSQQSASEINALNKTLLATANQLYQNGEYDRAFQMFKTVSENGEDIDAFFNLAMCYYRGLGTEKDIQQYLYWLKRAAELGDDQAMYNIAIVYHDGKDVERDLNEAKKCYTKSAMRGNMRALAELQKLQ